MGSDGFFFWERPPGHGLLLLHPQAHLAAPSLGLALTLSSPAPLVPHLPSGARGKGN